MCAVTVPLYSLCCDKPTHPSTHPEWTVNNLFLALALEFVAKHVVDHVLSSTVRCSVAQYSTVPVFVDLRFSSIFDDSLSELASMVFYSLSVRPSVRILMWSMP